MDRRKEVGKKSDVRRGREEKEKVMTTKKKERDAPEALVKWLIRKAIKQVHVQGRDFESLKGLAKYLNEVKRKKRFSLLFLTLNSSPLI